MKTRKQQPKKVVLSHINLYDAIDYINAQRKNAKKMEKAEMLCPRTLNFWR